MPIIYFSSLVTVVLYFLSKPSGFNFLSDPWLHSSQLIALVGTILFCLNYLLSSRLKIVEQLFGGFDKVYKTHHFLGAISFVFIINHPIFLAVRALPNSIAAKNFVFVGNNLSYNMGIFALYSMILVLIFTFIFRLPYHQWLSIHKLMGIPLFLVIFHVILISSDVSRYFPLRLWVISFLVIAVVGYVYKLMIYNRFGPTVLYKISKIIRHQSVSDIYLTPESRQLKYQPGQYVFSSFKQQFISQESHPFSISSSPADDYIRLSVKSLGDFTTALAGLKEGSSVSLTGPYGLFGQKFYGNQPVICIAGGIGITPFLSMIKTEVNQPLSRPIYFFNSVKTASESVYQSEIQEYQSQLPNLKYNLHCTDTENYLTAAKIQSDTPDFYNSLFFLCGPVSMMETISTQLQAMGIKRKNVIYEDFSFGGV